MHACKWGCKSRCGTLNGMGQHYRLVMAALEKGCPSDPLHVCQQARSKVNRMSMMTAKHDGDLHAATQSADCASRASFMMLSQLSMTTCSLGASFSIAAWVPPLA